MVSVIPRIVTESPFFQCIDREGVTDSDKCQQSIMCSGHPLSVRKTDTPNGLRPSIGSMLENGLAPGNSSVENDLLLSIAIQRDMLSCQVQRLINAANLARDLPLADDVEQVADLSARLQSKRLHQDIAIHQ